MAYTFVNWLYISRTVLYWVFENMDTVCRSVYMFYGASTFRQMQIALFRFIVYSSKCPHARARARVSVFFCFNWPSSSLSNIVFDWFRPLWFMLIEFTRELQRSPQSTVINRLIAIANDLSECRCDRHRYGFRSDQLDRFCPRNVWACDLAAHAWSMLACGLAIVTPKAQILV